MIYKLLFFATAVLFSSSGFGETSDQSELAQNKTTKPSEPDWPKDCVKQRQSEPFEQGMPLPCGKYPCAYNAPANICLKNAWDFNIFGSFIYWYASQDDMDIAYVVPNINPDPTLNNKGAVLNQKFNYEPGFKVGFGFNIDYDNWAFRAEYTWLHESVSTEANSPFNLGTGAPALWQTNDWFHIVIDDVPIVSSKWQLKFDMVDVGMERPFYEGTMLTVTPFAGLRGLWLRQKLNINAIDSPNVLTAVSNSRSTSWAVGPVTGMGGHWLLGSGFRFEGNALASLLYTRYTKIAVTVIEETLPNFPNSASIKDQATVRPVAQLNMGLGWGKYFHGCDRDYYLDISLDYEFLYFWRQNVMRNFNTKIQGFADDLGDLQMQGLTATFRFDF